MAISAWVFHILTINLNVTKQSVVYLHTVIVVLITDVTGIVLMVIACIMTALMDMIISMATIVVGMILGMVIGTVVMTIVAMGDVMVAGISIMVAGIIVGAIAMGVILNMRTTGVVLHLGVHTEGVLITDIIVAVLEIAAMGVDMDMMIVGVSGTWDMEAIILTGMQIVIMAVDIAVGITTGIIVISSTVRKISLRNSSASKLLQPSVKYYLNDFL